MLSTNSKGFLKTGGPDAEGKLGWEVDSHPENYDFRRPVVNGVIEDFDLMEKVWYYLFYKELRIDPSGNSSYNIFY